MEEEKTSRRKVKVKTAVSLLSAHARTSQANILHLDLGPVVQRPISPNPGLTFNPDLFFFSSKAFSRTIFSILFRVANHQIVDKKN